jgi:hypothetical protein
MSRTTSSVQKELDEIVAAVRANGFDLVEADGHRKVYCNGRPVLVEKVPGDQKTQQPVMIPSTPSAGGWRAKLVASLIRAKVLQADPKRAGQNGSVDEGRRAAKAEKRGRAEANRAESSRRQEATNELRARAKRTLGRLGTWQQGTRGGGGKAPRRSVSEFGRVAYAWAEANGAPRAGSVGGAEQAMKMLWNGGSLADDTREWMHAFLTVVETQEDPVGWYFGQLREHLGLADGEPAKVPTPDEPPEGEPAPEETAPAGPEPLRPEDEEDQRVRDLRVRLEELQADLTATQKSLVRTQQERKLAVQQKGAAEEEKREAEVSLAEALRRSRAEQEARQAAEAVALERLTPRVPHLALETLAELLAADEEAKGRALDLATRVARAELGAEDEA